MPRRYGFNEAAASRRGKLPLPKSTKDGARIATLRALVNNSRTRLGPLQSDAGFAYVFVDVKEQTALRALLGRWLATAALAQQRQTKQ